LHFGGASGRGVNTKNVSGRSSDTVSAPRADGPRSRFGFVALTFEEGAIQLANATQYGLSGSLWTRDIGRAIRVARELRTGLLSINSDNSAYLEAPFGGRKQSGIGREQGLEGLLDYTELKNVYESDV